MFLSVLLSLFSPFAVGLAVPPPPTGAQDGSSPNCSFPGGFPAGARPVGVSRVQDGDSFIAEDGRRIRLIGVNTPELGFRNQPGEPWARQARSFVERFVRDHPRLILVPGSEPRDSHDRYLVHPYTPEGQSLEALLVARGLGWAVAVPPNLVLAECLAGLERTARKTAQGLWRDNVVVPSADLTDGGFQRVAGKVEKVVFANAWWINLDGDLAGVIYPEHQGNFSRSRLRALEGRQVVLRGWVYPSHSRNEKPWRVKIESVHAIEGLSP